MRRLIGRAACLVLSLTVPAMAQDFAAKPTAEHERLKADVGTWDATVKSWMQGPQAEPTESKGVETNHLMPGGLWLLSHFEGSFAGAPFHGASATGYDTVKKKYVGTWVDSMSTSMMTMEGDYDAAAKSLTFQGKGVDPAGKAYDTRMTTTYKDADTKVFTMSMKSEETGKEYVKMMEITYVRRKK